MSVLFGLITAVVAAVTIAMLGFRDGDLPGDARVTVRRAPTVGGSAGECPGERAGTGAGDGCFAEIVVENGHDSPVLVSARARRASVLALVFASGHGRRTALTHSRRLAGIEVLGAVDGGRIRRYLLPLERARGAARVTVIVDQTARRTRVVTATLSLRASAARPRRSASPRAVAGA